MAGAEGTSAWCMGHWAGGREEEEEGMCGWSDGIEMAAIWSTGTWVEADEEPMFHFIMKLFFAEKIERQMRNKGKVVHDIQKSLVGQIIMLRKQHLPPPPRAQQEETTKSKQRIQRANAFPTTSDNLTACLLLP